MFGNPQRKSDNWLFPLGYDGVGYCQLKANLADFLLRIRNLNAEQSMSYEFVYYLIFVQIHLT